MAQTHTLKTISTYFDAVERGEKTFEVRKNDRAFQTGDSLILERWERSPSGYTFLSHPKRSLRRRISYMLQGGQFGIEPGYCVLGLEGEPHDR